jgi:TatD DNase family protein
MSLPELIDSHCHLNFDYAPKDEAALLAEARAAGVVTLVTVGTDMKSLPLLAGFSDRHENVFHTVGVHPHDSIDMKDEDLKLLEAASRHPKCRAIGEIGLDYHYDHSPREVQRKRLSDQLELAFSLKLPVVIHAREAEEDLLTALTSYAKKLPSGRIPGVIHCFTGTRPFGQACLDLGFFVSFSGILTFKTAEDLRASAQVFPLEKLVIETDSPFLAPIPHRGRKCEPSMVKLTAQKLAEVKGVSLEEVARVTTANARKLFSL